MTPVRVIRHPSGPRLYVAGQRLHHGTSGLVLAAVSAAIHRRWLLALGLLMAAHDRHDARLWLRRERYPIRTTAR